MSARVDRLDIACTPRGGTWPSRGGPRCCSDWRCWRSAVSGRPRRWQSSLRAPQSWPAPPRRPTTGTVPFAKTAQLGRATAWATARPATLSTASSEIAVESASRAARLAHRRRRRFRRRRLRRLRGQCVPRSRPAPPSRPTTGTARHARMAQPGQATAWATQAAGYAFHSEFGDCSGECLKGDPPAWPAAAAGCGETSRSRHRLE